MWNSQHEEVSGLDHELADVWENCNDLRDIDTPGGGGRGNTLVVARIALTFLKSVQYPLSVIKLELYFFFHFIKWKLFVFSRIENCIDGSHGPQYLFHVVFAQ